jgi:protein phosphatase 1 regulatory subunit 37
VTTRHPTIESGGTHSHMVGAGPRHDHGPSAALLDKVRALDALPRLGALRTLDLRGNDLRVSLFSLF